jgi:hypothetical protein
VPSENLPLTSCGKDEASASKLAALVSACWKTIAGKAVEKSLRKAAL